MRIGRPLKAPDHTLPSHARASLSLPSRTRVRDLAACHEATGKAPAAF